jgi:carboxylesterase type B
MKNRNRRLLAEQTALGSVTSTAEARALGAKMSDAWINFARSGNPNYSGLPSWPAFSPEKGPVMIFHNQCVVKNDPDRAERTLLREAGPR